jgi:beta-lactamase regulating signal transducer with metallopeptidase domain
MRGLAGNWLPHLLQAAWQATAVALVVLLLLRVLHRASPRLRHALVLIALLKFVIPPMLPLPTGLFSAAPPAPSIASVRGVVIAAMQPEALPIVVAFMLLHLGGVVFFLARLVATAWSLRRLCGRAAIGPDGIVLSTEVLVPMTTGVFRPIVVLPKDLPARLTGRELQDVIAHEREHVRRRDVLLNWLQELVIALWWFHPLVHLLAAEARTLREECCDDALIGSGRCDSAHYANTLLRAAVESLQPRAVAAAIAESPHALLRRVRRIADRRPGPSPHLGVSSVALIVLLALTLLPGLRVSPSNWIAFDHATIDAIYPQNRH